MPNKQSQEMREYKCNFCNYDTPCVLQLFNIAEEYIPIRCPVQDESTEYGGTWQLITRTPDHTALLSDCARALAGVQHTHKHYNFDELFDRIKGALGGEPDKRVAEIRGLMEKVIRFLELIPPNNGSQLTHHEEYQRIKNDLLSKIKDALDGGEP